MFPHRNEDRRPLIWAVVVSCIYSLALAYLVCVFPWQLIQAAGRVTLPYPR